MKKLSLRLVATSSLLALTVSANAADAQATAEQAASQAADAPAVAAPQVDSAPAADTQAQAASDIVVTGSRLGHASTFTSPTPVTSVSATELKAAGPATIAQGLEQLPSVVPGGGQTAGGGSFNGGQNYLNLRGLGTARTLILVDGRRFVPSGPNNLVDTNLIPEGLVSRVDVVTGGASAAYGSDAVAGIVNFILDKRFTGLKVDLSSGISQQGDNAEYKGTLTFGTSLLDNKLHLVASGEYFNSDGVTGDDRANRRTAANQIRNPAGTPTFAHATDIRTPYTTGGLVVIGGGGTAANNARFEGLQFNSGGGVSPYDYGTLATDIGVASGTQNGGDGFRVSTGQEVVRPLRRAAVFAHADFELSNSVSLFAEGSYANTLSVSQTSPNVRTLTISRSNPFLLAAAPQLVADMTTYGVTSLTVNRLIVERGPTQSHNGNRTMRLLGGVEGKLGGWSWNASYQYGQNRQHQFYTNNLLLPNITRAVNAVSSGGQTVCADTLSADPAVRAAAAGCVPFNPFGYGAPSAASLDYVVGTNLVFDTVTQQHVVDANVTGDVFKLPAGAVSIAVGGEYRSISSRTVADPLSNAAAFRVSNTPDFYGHYDIKEIYGEIGIPILKDSAIARSLDVNVAARHTEYSTSGGVNTWKGGVSWQVVDGVRFRVTRSRDIRAPNLMELYATGAQTNLTIDDTLFTGKTYTAVPTVVVGNPNLKPEVAETLVTGIVLQPAFLSGFSVAVDYYNIRVQGAIGTINGGDAVKQCNLSNQTSALCALVTRDPVTQAPIKVLSSPVNLAAQRTSGIDLESSYRVPLGAGRLTLRLLGTYVFRNLTTSPLILNPVDDAGNGTPQSNLGFAQPKFRATGVVNYDTKLLSVYLQGRYIGPLTWDKTKVLGKDTDFNHVAPQFYLDGQLAIKLPFLSKGGEFYINVQNLLNHQPPYDPASAGATPLPTDPHLYDEVGRMFRFGIHAKF
ncbi:MAG: hypothetical protein JWR80_5466 [Bradyrhizobium sp.]|nr:hypothetical protein [Bradyrhizobium sp.]